MYSPDTDLVPHKMHASYGVNLYAIFCDIKDGIMGLGM